MGNRIILLITFIGTFMLGCNDFNRLQKSTDLDKKYDAAVGYYNKEDYVKAQLIFDELYSVLRSTEKAENVAYYLAYCDYKMGDYIMASYLFRNYFRTYPTSTRASECLYMSAYCHYMVSPPWSLDQEDTYSAIDEFQYFIQMFPTDTAHIHECNKLVDLLHKKLEKKAFMNAKMYYNIADYKAAITAFNLVLHDYPDTHYREEAIFYTVEAKYYLASNSVEAKQEERVNDAIKACSDFLLQFPISEYTSQIKNTQDRALKLQDKILKNNKIRTNN
ncbi:MAG: outer membrane protein assembly factor BamD [Bacteroidetes bacterium]|jgi:outer membrane protein assembly factor BamD|nr:outer membrane protein assembly factor BamD [Bacteroidota bacterium]